MTGWIDRFSLKGRRALVTGASKGIGSEICRVLAEAGADIAAVARDPAGLAAVKKDVEALGRTCVAIEADLATIEGPREAWLIQVFFAHNLANEEIASLFKKRIEALRVYLFQCQTAQKGVDENYKQVGIKRLRDLWQLTLDYGIDYYENEIRWLEKTLPRVHKLPKLTPPKTT